MASNVATAATFLMEFLKAPTTIGAIAPSSRYLAEQMVRGSGAEDARVVVEYGPGTGAFTGAIREAIKPGARYFAIELSAPCAERFRQKHPGARLFLGSAADVPELCRNEGLSGHDCVDVVFSGLPFASFPVDLQTKILERTHQVLRPGGRFITFAYAGFSAMTPAGRRLRKLFPKYFSSITHSPVVLRNLPPAFVFRCTK
jgi:phosphatidylethanolamine/phosphatidyl-N-methylethanolamine N-methyltransferase